MSTPCEESLSRCGYRCDLCPAFIATQKNDMVGLSRLSQEFKNLYGFHLDAENLKCDGCMRELGRKVDKNCPVRPCCMRRGFRTCAECPDYVCDSLKKRLVDRSEIEKNLGHRISDQTYIAYVKPFESKARLDEIRQKHHGPR